VSRFKLFLAFLKRYGTAIWLAAILVLAIYVGTRQQDELAKTWDLMIGADPLWIATILVLEILCFVLISAVYGLVLRQFGHEVSLALMVSLHLQRAVINGLTPMGGASSVVVFVHRLRQRGVPPADSLLAAFIKSVSGHVAFLLILLPALFLERPTLLMVVSAICVIVLVGVMLTILSLVMRRHRLPKALISRIPRKGLRVLAQLRSHTLSPRAFVLPMILLVAFKFAGVMTLWLSLGAVGWEGGLVVPLTAYVVGVIFLVMAPIFQGIGIVDVGIALALERLGVPASIAISSTLISRILGLWLPVAIGILTQFAEAYLARRRAERNPQPVSSP
jgi:uncharacterized protein (TIRG00374 family)